MLRSRKKDANIKPNRKLDKRSSRGMLFENEELRLRTIEINAEVERGQCDLKKLRRENQRLRRDIWGLREEYERLEAEMQRMRKGDGGPGVVVLPPAPGRPFVDEDDEGGYEEEGEEEGDEDDDEEDEEEENAENLQKDFYNGRLSSVAEEEGPPGPCGACRGPGEVREDDGGPPAAGPEEAGPSCGTFRSGGTLEHLVREVNGGGGGGPEAPGPSSDGPLARARECPKWPSTLGERCQRSTLGALISANAALLELGASSPLPRLSMKDLVEALGPRLDDVLVVCIHHSSPGTATIAMRTPQDLEALLRTGLEIAGGLYQLSALPPAPPDPPSTPVHGGPCRETGGDPMRSGEETEEEGSRRPIAHLSAPCDPPRSPSPRPSHLSLPLSPSPVPGARNVQGHCRSASADTGNRPGVAFEDPSRTTAGILRPQRGEVSGPLQRSISLDPRGPQPSFHRRKGGGFRSGGGGSGMEADSEASRGGHGGGESLSSRGSGGRQNGGPGKGQEPPKELPWCGCWGNGCF